MQDRAEESLTTLRSDTPPTRILPITESPFIVGLPDLPLTFMKVLETVQSGLAVILLYDC